ncbi:MAG: DUF559 domain-containing protein [Burkholderiales bacterium]
MDDLSNRVLQQLALRRKLKLEFDELTKITDKWGFIRQAYMEQMPHVMAMAARDARQFVDPYLLDWLAYLSPIEQSAWLSIRRRGVPLYPQFPLFNYFIDFANPYFRVGLELDGRDWHDPTKDEERDQLLAQYGWRIFRVSGAEAVNEYEHPIELEGRDADHTTTQQEISAWLMSTCDGVVESIDQVYFRHSPDAYSGQCLRSLDRHRLAKFSLLDDDA